MISVGETDLIKRCDQALSDALAILDPIYTAMWNMILHVDASGFEAYEIEVAGLKATCPSLTIGWISVYNPEVKSAGRKLSRQESGRP